MKNQKAYSFLILIAGILWGCIGLFVRPLNDAGLSSIEIVSLRAIVTAVAMLVVLLIKDKSKIKIKLKDVWCFVGTGICSIVFFNYCYFKSIEMASLSVAAILLYTAPAIVMVASYFLFKESFTKVKVLSLILTFVGCVLVTGVIGSAAKLSLSGILFGLGAGFGYALYSIFSRFAIERGYDSLTITFYTFLLAAVCSLFMADGSHVTHVATSSPKTLAFCVAFGILCTVLPYLLYTTGLKNVENSRAAIIASIEPVTATLLGIVLFHEKATATGMIGVIMVLAALVICNLKVEAKS